MGAFGWEGWGMASTWARQGCRQEAIKQVGNRGTSWQGAALGRAEAGAGGRAEAQALVQAQACGCGE